VSSSLETNKPAFKANQAKAKHEPKHWLEYAIFAFVIVTAAATSFAAYYTRGQWITAQDAEERDLRAYFYVIFAPKSIQLNQPISLTISATNIGRTPAYKVRNCVYSGPTGAGQLAPEAVLAKEPHEGECRTRFAVGPSPDVFEAPYDTKYIFTLEHALLMMAGGQYFYVWGRIDYTDIFHCRRYVKYCYVVWGQGLKTVQECPEGRNETDDADSCQLDR
jgi:hypothetical protein